MAVLTKAQFTQLRPGGNYQNYLSYLANARNQSVSQVRQSGAVSAAKFKTILAANPPAQQGGIAGGGGTGTRAQQPLRSGQRLTQNPVDAIIWAARRLGLDPAAMLAVSMQESGWSPGATGDGGYSLGLFQFNFAGGYGSSLASRFGDATARRLARDPLASSLLAGRGMVGAGARGLTGLSAIQRMVRGFERPAADYSSYAFSNFYDRAQREVRRRQGVDLKAPSTWWARPLLV